MYKIEIRPSRLNGPEIDAEAIKVSESYKYNSRLEDVRKLAEKITGKPCIEVLPFDDIGELKSGSLKVFGHNDFKIYLSRGTSQARDSFTIAHELGHYFLHSGTPPGSEQIEVGRTDIEGSYSLVERQANRFAASLLMPASQFKELFTKTNGDTLMIAGLLKLSRQAVDVRARSLGLIKD